MDDRFDAQRGTTCSTSACFSWSMAAFDKPSRREG